MLCKFLEPLRISFLLLEFLCGKISSTIVINRCSEKRVSAVAISNDGQHVCFADKFGVVWVVDLRDINGNQAVVDKKAAPLLAHYCSIITSLVSNSR